MGFPWIEEEEHNCTDNQVQVSQREFLGGIDEQIFYNWNRSLSSYLDGDSRLECNITAHRHVVDRIFKPANKAASVLEYISTSESHATIIAVSNIESGLGAVFGQVPVDETEGVIEEQLELDAYKAEEIGLAVAASSRLLTKLLSLEQFHQKIYTNLFQELRNSLKSTIPLHAKNWVAACLVIFESLITSGMDLEKPIDVDVTVYETIPRLVEQMRTGFSLGSRVSACVELNRVISVFPLVELLEEGNDKALEASLAILYNLSMDSENHSAILSCPYRRGLFSRKTRWGAMRSVCGELFQHDLTVVEFANTAGGASKKHTMY